MMNSNKKIRRLYFCAVVLFTMFVSLGSGCVSMDIRYVVTAGIGQLNVVSHSVPLDDVIDDPDLDDEKHDKLVWVRQVRDYAADTLSLEVKNTYTTYYDTGDGPAAYNLSASRKDALEPYTWNFPIIGTIQYLGYFSEHFANKKADTLVAKGYDVTIYGAIAYSTLGYFRDPVFSSLLALDKAQLAETVVHELTHNTVYSTADSEFNESVATFVGRRGGRAFIRQALGDDSDLLTQADDYQEDSEVINDFMAQIYNDLNEFYNRTDLTSDQKIAQRDEVFIAARNRYTTEIAPKLHYPENYSSMAEMPINNAWVLLHRRYNKDLSIFEQVYQACNQDLIAAIEIFKQAADTDNPYQYLTDWVANQG
jgi:predicted aminopeptidase